MSLFQLSVRVSDDITEFVSSRKRLKTKLHTTCAVFSHLGYHSSLHSSNKYKYKLTQVNLEIS